MERHPSVTWLLPGAAALCAAAVTGCIGDRPARHNRAALASEAPSDDSPLRAPGTREVRLGNEPGRADENMDLEFDRGTFDQGEVEILLEKHTSVFTDCYERAGRTQKYVGGQVMLRFVVSEVGKVDDVLVVENDLGNYAVERCLVVEARKIEFPVPRGHKTAEFEYPLRFRPTGEKVVVDWEADAVHTQVRPLLAKLEPCPTLPEQVTAVIYIERDGSISSAGLAAPSPLDPQAGVCALEQVRKWRLSGDGDHVIRTRFALRGSLDTSGGSPPRTAARVRRHAKRRR